MTTVTNTTGSTGATSSPATAANGYAALGMGDFLTLLTTQMKNQDPTQPVDNTQMVSQMAQFSSLAGINTTNTTLDATNSTLDTSNTTLSSIAGKLDAMLAAQQAAASTKTASTTGV